MTGAAAAAGSGAAAAYGRFALAGWLYFLCGILDILDGRVARIRGQVSQAGAFLDSVIDRYAELFVFGGMTVFYRDSWALSAVLLASLGSLMVSYTRARGEALVVRAVPSRRPDQHRDRDRKSDEGKQPNQRRRHRPDRRRLA